MKAHFKGAMGFYKSNVSLCGILILLRQRPLGKKLLRHGDVMPTKGDCDPLVFLLTLIPVEAITTFNKKYTLSLMYHSVSF